MGENHHIWNNSGYTANNPSAWAPPIPPVIPHPASLPRFDLRSSAPKSESDDCDDVFSEESSKDRCSSPNDDCQMGFSRKKRRGIIEKRRRDRINTSLSELRRLVPSAFEKQGSAKLEKAEILQMTVDHLKSVHSRGVDAFSYDPHKVAMDYHSMGFRECAAEVARYLVTVEGMDIQDPLRLRLMSHLQCFAAQRELASKQAGTPWNYNSYPPSIHDYPTNSYEVAPTHQLLTPTSSITSHHQPNRIASNQQEHRLAPSSSDHQQEQHDMSPSRREESPRNTQSSGGYPPHQSYPPTAFQQGYSSSGQVKPYRPWGAEVAY